MADRHRTLAASIGWSHDLLAASDQALLHGLSVFSGGYGGGDARPPSRPLRRVRRTAGPLLERDQDRWRTALLAEHDNLRAALEWGLAAPDPGRARRLTAALARFWFVTRHVQEGRSFLDRALAAAPEDRTGL